MSFCYILSGSNRFEKVCVGSVSSIVATFKQTLILKIESCD